MAKKEIQEQEERNTIRPLANICEEQDKVLLSLEMPGVTKENVSLKVENNELQITGRRSEPQTDDNYLIRERRDGDYFQAYTLDNTINQDSIEAEMDSGILLVSLHLKEEVKPRQIEVKVK
jgi:HSP20 family protein